MIIGNFTYNKAQDSYTGELATLEVDARKVMFRAIEARPTRRPLPGRRSHKTGDVEFGAAWKKRSEEGRVYLSVRLDDPSLTQPLNCALVEQGEGEGFILVWSREARKAKAE